MKRIHKLPVGFQRLLLVLSIVLTLAVVISFDDFESFIEGLFSRYFFIILLTMAAIWIAFWLFVLLVLWIIDGFSKP